MKLTDPLFADWQARACYPAMVPNFTTTGYGADAEPVTSLWLASLSQGIGDRFREGLKVLDYGCGRGRYFNFLCKYFCDFTYYGVEMLVGRKAPFTEELAVAIRTFACDPRAHFAEIGSAGETEALKNADVVVLGSIFTHLTIGHSWTVLDKLLPIVYNRSGIIVFSAILAKHYNVSGAAGSYGLKDCYHTVYNTAEQYEKFCAARNVALKQVDVYDQPTAQHLNHTIYRIEALK